MDIIQAGMITIQVEKVGGQTLGECVHMEKKTIKVGSTASRCFHLRAEA